MTLPALAAVVFLALPTAPSLTTGGASSRLQWATTTQEGAADAGRTAGQIGAQIGFGALGGLTLGAGGLLVGLFTGLGACSNCWIPGLITGFSLGSVLGSTLGVSMGGGVTGAHGSIPMTFLLAALGAVPAIGMSLFPAFHNSLSGGFALMLGGVLPLAGAVIGYGLGGSAPSGPVTWMPTFVPRPGGGTFAVVGTL